MQRVHATAAVPASPADVFAFLSDLEQLPRWQAGIVSSRLTTPAPIGPGSRAEVVRDFMGQRLGVDLRLTEYQPDRRLALASAVRGVAVRGGLDIEPAEGGSQLTFSMEIRAQSLLMRPLEGAVARAAEREVADSLERVRAHFAGQGEASPAR